jgi:hypothetical protein
MKRFICLVYYVTLMICCLLNLCLNKNHSVKIDCIVMISGKRIENLRKLFEKAFQEAIWREPSVVLLDDLDHVTAAPAGPDQEMSGETLYYTRVAEGTI